MENFSSAPFFTQTWIFWCGLFQYTGLYFSVSLESSMIHLNLGWVDLFFGLYSGAIALFFVWCRSCGFFAVRCLRVSRYDNAGKFACLHRTRHQLFCDGLQSLLLHVQHSHRWCYGCGKDKCIFCDTCILEYLEVKMTQGETFSLPFFSGIGMGFQYVPALLAPQMCFDKKRALAIAITISGCPIGSFLFCPTFQFLINTYGWRGAMLITGAIVLHGCAFGLFLTPKIKHLQVKDKEELKELRDEARQCETKPQHVRTRSPFVEKLKTAFDISSIKSSQLLSAFVMWLCFCLALPVPSTFLPLVAMSYGISKNTASYMLSVYGCFDFFGRLLYGFVGTMSRMKSAYLWCFVAIVAGTALISLSWTKMVPMMYCLLVLYGLHHGLYLFPRLLFWVQHVKFSPVCTFQVVTVFSKVSYSQKKFWSCSPRELKMEWRVHFRWLVDMFICCVGRFVWNWESGKKLRGDANCTHHSIFLILRSARWDIYIYFCRLSTMVTNLFLQICRAYNIPPFHCLCLRTCWPFSDKY